MTYFLWPFPVFSFISNLVTTIGCDAHLNASCAFVKPYNLGFDFLVVSSLTGKPLKESQGEVAYGVSFIDWYAAEALRCHGSGAYDVNSETMAVMSREPVGVVLAVTPWNFPCAMITRKVAAAIAAGCTCISKPSDQTPLTCLGRFL